MSKTTVNRVTFALSDAISHMDPDQNVLSALTEDYAEGTAAFRERSGTDAVEHLGRLGVLGPDLTLVHMIHVTDQEVRLLADSGTSVVHCPGASVRPAPVVPVPRRE